MALLITASEEQKANKGGKTGITREDWLNQVAQRMRPLFADAGAELPERFRITMSLTKRQKAIGVCFDRSASADETYEILVRLDQHEPVQVAAILAHELVHAAVGVNKGRGPVFGKVARAIGLEGKLTATVPGERFIRKPSTRSVMSPLDPPPPPCWGAR